MLISPFLYERHLALSSCSFLNWRKINLFWLDFQCVTPEEDLRLTVSRLNPTQLQIQAKWVVAKLQSHHFYNWFQYFVTILKSGWKSLEIKNVRWFSFPQDLTFDISWYFGFIFFFFLSKVQEGSEKPNEWHRKW